MKEKNLTITLGTDSFKKLVTTSDVFVDKTLFIQEVIDSGEDAILITRPRRWGKSLALDMLKTFLGIEVNASGAKLDVNPNRVLFDGGAIGLGFGESKELEPLKIAREDAKYMRRQGQFPVIFISFKDARGDSYDAVINEVTLALKKAFDDHPYLAASTKLSTEDKARYTRHCNRQYTDKAELHDSLRFLSYLLCKHHNERFDPDNPEIKTYILVDEYDKPVNYFLERSFAENKEARTQVAQLMTSIMSSCGKGNHYLEKIVITGILDAFKKEGESGFNNVKVFDIQSMRFSKSFGFSEEEVDALISTLQFGETRSIVRDNIRAWYNGYNVAVRGGTTISVYTPWAVMNYLQDAYIDENLIPKSYWIGSGVNRILDNLSALGISGSLLNKLKSLAEGTEVMLSVEDDFHLFKELTDSSVREELIVYLLLSNGYISKKSLGFVIPNNEVLRYFNKQVLKAWIEREIELNKLGNKDEILKELSVSLSNATEFKKKVQSLILDKVKAGDKTESYFQSLVGGVIELHAIHNGDGATHTVLSEKTVRFGRTDNIFYPKESVDAAHSGSDACAGGISATCAVDASADSPRATSISSPIIHEYKKLDATAMGGMAKVLDDAMWQILEKGYLAEPLSKKAVHAHFHRWDRIKIRSVVFVRDDSSGRWSIDIVERELLVEQAEMLRAFFSDKLVKTELDISNKRRKSEDRRSRFLQILNEIKGIEKLDGLGSLIDAIIFPGSCTLDNLRQSKLAGVIKNQSQLAQIVCSIFDAAYLPAELISGKIKNEYNESISVDVIKSLVDCGRKRPFSVVGSPMVDVDAVGTKVVLLDATIAAAHGSAGGAGASTSSYVPSAGGGAGGPCSHLFFCTVRYDNPFYNYPHIATVLKRAKEIGDKPLLGLFADVFMADKKAGAELVAELETHGIERTLYALMDSAQEYSSEDTPTRATPTSKSVLHLKLGETPESIATREAAADPLYKPFIDLAHSIATIPSVLHNTWHWGGKIMTLIQEMVDSTMPETQTDAQTARLGFLFGLLEHMRSAGPFMPLPYFPRKPDDSDDFGGGGLGGGGYGKGPDGGGSGFGLIGGSDNESLVGDVNEVNGTVL